MAAPLRSLGFLRLGRLQSKGQLISSFRQKKQVSFVTPVLCRKIHKSSVLLSAEDKNASEKTSVYGHLLLIIPLAAFGLGTWQIQRRKWKLGLIKELEEKTTAEPVDLPLNEDELQQLEYRRVHVRGYFDHSRELHLLPRSLIAPEHEQKRSMPMASSGESGMHIITPFYCLEQNTWILVNRGWVSRKKVDPSTRAAGQVEGEIDLVGIVRSTENRAPFMPDNDPRRNRWHFKDLDIMSKWTGTAPILIDAVYDGSIPGGPVGGQTRITLRNEHMQYILTWYSLAIITTLLWWFGVFKKRRSPMLKS